MSILTDLFESDDVKARLKDEAEAFVEQLNAGQWETYHDGILNGACVSTQSGAFDKCTHISNLLRDWLEHEGEFTDAKIICCEGFKQNIATAHRKWQRITPNYWVHYVVEAAGYVIDLTFRQFVPDSPFPLIVPAAQYKLAWDEIREF